MWELLQNTQEDQSESFVCEHFWQLANTFLSLKFMVNNVSTMVLACIFPSISKPLAQNNYS